MYRKPMDKIAPAEPHETFCLFFKEFAETMQVYTREYLPILKHLRPRAHITETADFAEKENFFDVLLTSPPYGDSSTTVAYGQFSHFGAKLLYDVDGRTIDARTLGGMKRSPIFNSDAFAVARKTIASSIDTIAIDKPKRASEVERFYSDLFLSIAQNAKSVRQGGYAVYIVGNRRVSSLQLPTDQFVAASFEQNGFSHVKTYPRKIGNKSMPLRNSPTNKPGQCVPTMAQELIVIMKKELH